MPDKPIFRRQALEKLSSPEQLDQLLRVLDRKSWLPLLVVAAALALAVVWSVFGRIPVTVEGQGLLVYPRRIASLQSPAGGQIVALNVNVGERVRKGELIARLNQPELVQRLEQERERLAELRSRSGRILELQTQRIELEKKANRRQRDLLQQRIESARELAQEVKARNEAFIAKQQENLQRLMGVSRTLGAALQQRYQNFLSLQQRGLTADETVLEARRNALDNEVQMADLELRLTEIELNAIQARDAFLQQMDRVAEMEARLEELDVRNAQLDQQLAEATADNQLQILEVQSAIERYQQELADKALIVSEYDGRVLEITSAVGQIISAGQRLGSIETEDERGELVAVSYFEVGDGKKIAEEMAVRVSPATVQRERFGSLLGEVRSVSRFPVTTEAITNVVGSAEVAQGLARLGPRIEVFTRLQEDAATPSGYRWTSGVGPQIRISAGTTVATRVTVDYRRPITYVLPLLRSWSGL